MGRPDHFGARVPEAAAFLVERLGAPDLGVILGSGWSALGSALGASGEVDSREIPGFPTRAGGSSPTLGSASVGSGRAWVLDGRLHLYEGYRAGEVAFPVALLAEAGARRMVLTCAAGGLLEDDRPGNFAVIVDHLNLTGTDPLSEVPMERRDPEYLDLQDAYDRGLAAAWREAARNHHVSCRDGVFASVRGPCYETPAEVRMLRAAGADLVSMSVVVETIAAIYLSVPVAAIACVANRGAAGRDPIRHGYVLDVVDGAVRRSAPFLRDGIDRMLDVVSGSA